MKRIISPNLSESTRTRLVERPDGFYWQSADGRREYGPFATLIEARLDMKIDDEETPEAGGLDEAEADIGMSAWIDPDTGEVAEEQRTRIEDH